MVAGAAPASSFPFPWSPPRVVAPFDEPVPTFHKGRRAVSPPITPPLPPSSHWSKPVHRRVLAVLLTSFLSVGIIVVAGGASPANAATGTIISLTFDDANADQYAAAQKLKSKGM